jgi:hypothetical protein
LPSLESCISKRQILLDVAILSSRDPTDLNHNIYTALLDTGATSSGIGPKVIHELGLRSHQKKPLSVATEMRMVEYYLFRIGLFMNSMPGDLNTLPYIFEDTEGFSWKEQKSFDVILGMDIIGKCDFSLNKNGQWKLNFGI